MTNEQIEDRTSLSTEFLHNAELAQLPTAALRDGATAWVSDGRSPSEGSGAGTGVMAVFHAGSSEWRDLRTGVAVLT